MFFVLSCSAFAQSIEAVCLFENEDEFGAAPTGNAPIAYEWSIIFLPTNVRLILNVWRYIIHELNFVVVSVVPEQWYDCLSASEVILNKQN